MSKTNLFEAFEAVSKQEWQDFVSQDPKSAGLMDKLHSNLGGVSVPAYASIEDIQQSTNTQGEVVWQMTGSWRIAELISSHQALSKITPSSGTDAFWIQSPEFLSKNLQDLQIPCYLQGPAFRGEAGLQILASAASPPAAVSVFDDTTLIENEQSTDLVQQFKATRVISITVDGNAERAADELAQGLRIFQHYARQFLAKDISLKSLLDSLQFVFLIGPSFYLEIARIRAFKMVLSKLILALVPAFKDVVNVSLVADIDPSITQVTDENTAMLGNTTKAMSAIMGGCDLVLIRPFHNDHSGTLYSRMARNTQLMLKHEAHLDRVTDPAAGSYYVEVLTQQLAQSTWDAFLAMENKEGA